MYQPNNTLAGSMGYSWPFPGGLPQNQQYPSSPAAGQYPQTPLPIMPDGSGNNLGQQSPGMDWAAPIKPIGDRSFPDYNRTGPVREPNTGVIRGNPLTGGPLMSNPMGMNNRSRTRLNLGGPQNVTGTGPQRRRIHRRIGGR